MIKFNSASPKKHFLLLNIQIFIDFQSLMLLEMLINITLLSRKYYYNKPCCIPFEHSITEWMSQKLLGKIFQSEPCQID